jgi:hypothetical protein
MVNLKGRNALPETERNQYLAKVGDNLDPELQQAFLEAPEHTKLLPTDLEAIHMRALKAQHGEEAFKELAELEAGIKIADDTITIAREEIAFEAGGIAKFDEAAKPFEKMSNAVYLKKFAENGVEITKAFSVIAMIGIAL